MVREGEGYGWEVTHWEHPRSFVYFDLDIDEIPNARNVESFVARHRVCLLHRLSERRC